jgi:hypothetical protein
MKPSFSGLLAASSLLCAQGVTVFAFMAPHAAFASPSYATAREHFNNGNLSGTQKTLESILLPKPKVSGKNLEEARKLYGVTLFLMGKKQNAEKVFSAVLTTNPKAKISPEDLLDPQIATLFENARTKVKSSGASEKSFATADQITKKTAPKLPVAPPNAAIVVLSCNVKKASVFVNGIYVGNCDTPVTVNPGQHEITVASEGYEDASKDFQLKGGQSVGFNVNLKPYSVNSDDDDNVAFGEKPPNHFDDDATVQKPLPVPQKQPESDALIQLQPLQNGADPQVFIQPQAYSGRGSQSGSVVPRRSYLVALMPFGAGQFQNGEPTKGALSLGLQLTGVGIWAYSVYKNSTFQAKVDKDPSAYNDNEVSKYKKNMKNLGNASLGAFGFVYFVSMLDALINIKNPAIVKLNSAAEIRFAALPNGSAQVVFRREF